jgi:uncharacterized YccA/Bax inhibitor family protein
MELIMPLIVAIIVLFFIGAIWYVLMQIPVQEPIAGFIRILVILIAVITVLFALFVVFKGLMQYV